MDRATCYHQAVLLRSRDSERVGRKFLIPTEIVHDQGGEFEAGFVAMLESHSIASNVTGAHLLGRPAWLNDTVAS